MDPPQSTIMNEEDDLEGGFLESAMGNVKISEEANYDFQWLKGTAAETAINGGKSSKNPTARTDFSHPIYKTISKLNGKINSMSHIELSRCLKDLKLDPSGKKEVLVKRLKNYHKQLHLNRSSLTKTENSVFDYVCVIDFEATCDDVNKQDYPHEIIEFPIVLVNIRTMMIEDYFQSYVRPTINPQLSKFCVHLTGITQEKVDNAEGFPDVLNRVNEWLQQKQLGGKFKFAVASDGPWDFENFLNLQCLHCELPFPHWAKRWIDVRKLFASWFNVRRCGIEKMLGYLGLTFEGQQHCGLDDAKNISKILMKLASDGCELKLNERLRQCRTCVEKSPLARQSSDEQAVVAPAADEEDDDSNIDMKE